MKFRFKEAELGVFNTKNADDVVKDLTKGARIMGLTRGEFSLIDLIHSILKVTGPAHVICTTWSAGIKDAHQVRWMVGTDLIRSFKLITDYSFEKRQAKYAASITDLFGVDNIRTSDIHAKFLLIHNEGWKVTVRTSMNLNANRTCESFEIDEDPDIFAFYMNFVEHTFGTMPAGFVDSCWTVNKNLDKFFNEEQTPTKHWSQF